MPEPAPACLEALHQATKLWPNRDKSADGIMPSLQHHLNSPTSDHELGNAVDLTHDPDNGCDAYKWAHDLAFRRDRRVKYVISNRKIWSTERASEGWRMYDGDNPHDHHTHVSIYEWARGDCSNWFDYSPEEFTVDDKSKAEIQAMLDATLAEVRKEVNKAVETITGGVRKRDAKGVVIDSDKVHISLADVLTKLEK